MNVTEQRGFSLIEVLLAAMLLGIVSVGMTSMMTSLQADQNGVKWRMDADTFTEEVRALLSSSAACTNTFGGMTATGGASHPVTYLRDGQAPPGQVVYQADSIYGDSSVKITSLTLTTFVAGPVASRAQMTLVAGLMPAKRASGAQYIKREINVSLEVNALSNITSCVAAAKMSDGLWQRMPSQLGNIYFQNQVLGGFVGINTSAPTTTLDVAGPLRVTTPSHRNMPMSLIPNTEGLGGAFFQGLGFNLEFDRASQVYAIGGDGVNSGAGALLLDHANGALMFMAVPSMVGSNGYTFDINYLRNQERMRLDAAGRLGIGTTNPQYQLHLATDSAAKPGSGAWTIASDARLKDLGPVFRRGLDAIKRIRPRYFSYRAGNALGLPSDREYVGVTAQNILSTVPEAVSTDDRGYLHVTNDAIQWAMLNAIRELSAEHDQLRAEFEALRAR